MFEDTIDAVSSVSGARQIILKTIKPATEADVSKIAGLPGVISASLYGGGIEMNVSPESARNPDLFRLVGESNIGVYEMQEGASLESTYLSLVKGSR